MSENADLREQIGKWLVANLFWGIDYQRGPEAAERLLTEVPALQRLVEQEAATTTTEATTTSATTTSETATVSETTAVQTTTEEN